MKYDFDSPLARRGRNCMKWDNLSEVFGRDDLLPFWVADMDFRSAPEIIDVLKEQVEFGVFGYPLMTDSARASVAEWQAKRHGWNVDVAEVGFTPGVVTALSVAVEAFTEPGDGVVVQTPIYPPFFKVIRDNGRQVVENPLLEGDEEYRMDLEHFKRILSPNVKALILCSPHNPVARVWRREELCKLAEICVERNIMIFSDEIHQDLVYSDAKHTPIALAAPEVESLLLTLVAPSKTFNIAGICASAWIARDPKIRERMSSALSRLHISGLNLFAVAALDAAYRKGGPWLDQLIPYLEKNRSFVETFLAERMPGVKLKHPQGTFVFWLDFRSYGLSSKELQRVLTQEAGVALNPGVAFGKQGEGFARFNIGCPITQVEEGLSRMSKAFARL